MAGGIGLPQDSTRRALVRTSPKNLLGRSPGKKSGLRRLSRMGELGAASRVYDERPAARGALDPAPRSRGRSCYFPSFHSRWSPRSPLAGEKCSQKGLGKADDSIEGPGLLVVDWGRAAPMHRGATSVEFCSPSRIHNSPFTLYPLQFSPPMRVFPSNRHYRGGSAHDQ